jgi:hypothetical protein
MVVVAAADIRHVSVVAAIGGHARVTFGFHCELDGYGGTYY